MIPRFARKELLSGLWIQRGIVPNTLTAGSTVNTYSAAPQPAAGIDSWDAGNLLFRNVLVVVDVASVSGSGALSVSLRDSSTAITTSNGNSVTSEALSLANITASGLYVAEVRLTHVFPKTSARYLMDSSLEEIRRYHSIRATATGCDFTFAAWLIYGNNLRDFPVQDATVLNITWADS